MNNCKNCNEPVVGNYCSNCGQVAKINKIDGKYLVREMGDFFAANKGFLYTIKKLIVSPGNSVRNFITEDRHRFVKPITFLIITSFIYTIINRIFNIDTAVYFDSNLPDDSAINFLFTWMMIDYPGYASIITGFFMAFWLKLLFRKTEYNIYEVFILLCFVSGMTNLFISVTAIIQGITASNAIQIGFYIGIAYTVWAVAQFFNRKTAGSYVKVFLSYILGLLILTGLIAAVGFLIDTVIK